MIVAVSLELGVVAIGQHMNKAPNSLTANLEGFRFVEVTINVIPREEVADVHELNRAEFS